MDILIKNKDLEDLVLLVDGVSITEEWRFIAESQNKYKVSSFGRVKRLQGTSFNHACGGTYNLKEKIMMQSLDKDGYCILGIQVNGKRKTVKAHRLVANAFLENPENKPEVNHKYGVKHNNFYWDLEWASESENILHAIAFGLHKPPKGTRCSWSKLTAEKVLAIRRLYRMNPKFNRTYIANKLNISSATITLIINRKNWKHI